METHVSENENIASENSAPVRIGDDAHLAVPPPVRVTEASGLVPGENAALETSSGADAASVSPLIAQQFTTPLKALPPLKDIEPIATPRSFDVAKDTNDPGSSPVVARAEPAADYDENLINTSFVDDTFAHPSSLHGEFANDKLQVIASFLDIPVSELSSVSTSIIRALEGRSADFESLRSQLSLAQVNEEQAAHLQNKKVEALQGRLRSLDAKYQQAVLENETRSDEKGVERQEMAAVRQEKDTLRLKLDHLELQAAQQQSQYASALSQKDQEIIRLNASLSRLTQSNVDDSQKLNQLTRELSDTRNDKFSVQLELSKASNELRYLRDQKEWFETELKKVQGRYSESLKKAETDYLGLTSKVDALTAQKALLEKMNGSYKDTVAKVQAELEAQTAKLVTAESRLEVEKIKYDKDVKNKEDLNELLRVQSEQRADHIKQMEAYTEEVLLTLTKKVHDLEATLVQRTTTVAELEEKLRRTEEVLDAELHKATELPKLSQTAELIAGEGISLSSLYVEFNQLKKQLVFEKSQKAKLAAQLESFVSELEDKRPVIASYQEQIQFYETSLKDMIAKVEVVRLERAESDKEVRRLKGTVTEYENSLVANKKLCRDLGTQLCYYLIHLRIRDNDEEPLSASERRAIDSIMERSGHADSKAESDTDALILQRLVGFASIVELQRKNESLLTVVRELGQKLELRDQAQQAQLESAAIEEAKEAIITLEAEIDSLTIKLEALTKERDQLRALERGNPVGSASEVRYLSDVCDDLRQRVASGERSLRESQAASAGRIGELNSKLADATARHSELVLQVSQHAHAAEMAEVRLSNLHKLLENSRQEAEQLRTDMAFWKQQAAKQEAMLVRKLTELSAAEARAAEQHTAVNSLRTERDMAVALQASLREDIDALRADKERLALFVASLQALLKEKEASSAEILARLDQAVENYQALQLRLAERDDKITMLTSQAELELRSQFVKVEQVGELSQRLAEARSALAEKTAMVEELRQLQGGRNPGVSAIRSGLSETAAGADTDESRFEALRIAEQQVAEFSAIAKGAERALLDATASFEQFKTAHEGRVSELESLRASQQAEIDRLQKELHAAQDAQFAAAEKHTSEVHELNGQFQEAVAKAGSYDQMKSDFEARLASVRADLEAQESRNVDLEKRSSDSLGAQEALERDASVLREQIGALQEQVSAARRELEAEKNRQNGALEQQTALVRELEEELQRWKTRYSEANEQNRLLLVQLEVGEKSVAPGPEPDSSDLSISQVVRYLRTEKENAEAQAVALNETVTALRHKLEHTSVELEARNSELLRAQKTAVDVEDAEREHKRIMEQLEQLAILRESNTTLRNENNTLAKRVADLERDARLAAESLELLKSLQAQVTDTGDELQQKVRLLEEENARIKANLAVATDNAGAEEVEALKKRFTNLKTEFQNKLLVHRGKTKELEKVVESLRAELAAKTSPEQPEKLDETLAQLQAAQADKTRLEAQLQVLQKSASKAAADEVLKVRSQLEQERAAVELSLGKKLKAAEAQIALLKESSSDAEVSQLVQKAVDEEKRKLDQSLAARKTQLEAEYEEKVKAAQASSGSKEVADKYESDIAEMKQQFETRLSAEVEDIKKKTEKKFEIKVRMLNKKIDKLEGKANEQPAPAGDAGQNSPNSNGAQNSATAGSPHSELTLTVHRPQVDRGQKNDKSKKRPFPNKPQPNKKPKDGNQ